MAELETLKAKHGGECMVLWGHEVIEAVEHIPAGNGCDEFVNIGE
jgi:hypothetical protein